MAAPKIGLTQLVLCALLGVIDLLQCNAILDGDLADEHEFPYQVSLRIFGKHKCGGTIIDSRHILTAAHCVAKVDHDNVANVTVTAGTNYIDVGMGEEYRSKNITIHPGFYKTRWDRFKDDIAIITLDSVINLDHTRRPANLPTSDTPVDSLVITCGWGLTSYPNGTSSSGLRKLWMVVYPNSRCLLPGHSNLHETQICAFARMDAGGCKGDSGGPLLNGRTVVGVASFVVACGRGYPDVFTRVHSYVDWINEVTKIY